MTELLNEAIQSEVFEVFHQGIQFPARLKLDLLGEEIKKAEVETGLVQRQLEKAFLTKSWRQGTVYAARLDPEGAAFTERLFCQTVEEQQGEKLPIEVLKIRALICELGRISMHQLYLALVARSLELDTVLHLCLRDREKVLDLFELLSGSRFALNYFSIGGSRYSVSAGFLERARQVRGELKERVNEYRALLSENKLVELRTKGVGIVPRKLIESLDIQGPNARASGDPRDLRKEDPGLSAANIQELLRSPIPNTSGDVHARIQARVYEINQSIDIVAYLVKELSENLRNIEKAQQAAEEIRPDDKIKVPKGQMKSRLETPRGILECEIESSGAEKPERVKFYTPSTKLIKVAEKILIGERIQDLLVILSSLQISIPEVDK